MTITPLYLVAWILIYCGFSLLRASVPPYRRDSVRFGARKKRALLGYLLLLFGAAFLMVALLRHHHVR
jgi:hypothetical protein